MLPASFAATPIPTGILPTPLPNGRLERQFGNDNGWEETLPTPLTVLHECHDRMEPLHPKIYSWLWHAKGAPPPLRFGTKPKEGAATISMARHSMNVGLLEANNLLALNDCEVIVGEAWRNPRVQHHLWVLDFMKLAGQRDPKSLAIAETFQLGEAASRCSAALDIKRNKRKCQWLRKQLRRDPTIDWIGLAAAAGKSQETVIDRTIIYLAHLGLVEVELDETTTSPHGSGGAVDVALLRRSTGELLPLGVPHGYTFGDGNEIAWMDFFERPNCEMEYRRICAGDPIMQAYLGHFGQIAPTDEFIDQYRTNRRILFGAMREAGFTYFYQECWHFNVGHHDPAYRRAGSTCHSLCLGNPPLDGSKLVIGVFGNSFAITDGQRVTETLEAALRFSEKAS